MTYQREDLFDKILGIEAEDFDDLAMDVYNYQLSGSPVFNQYVKNLLKGNSNKDTPVFLPISAFKTNKIITGNWHSEKYFESSGTTSTGNSRHYIRSEDDYLSNARSNFEEFYGEVRNYCILALLPHYLERQNSSLVSMVSDFVNLSKYSVSGFFLNNEEELFIRLNKNKGEQIPTILFGVSFALLDFAEKYSIEYEELIIMETGGMKGRREETTKEKLHALLKDAFSTLNIHSEYGMTELFSQAYSKENGLYFPPKTMKVITTEITDPLKRERYGRTGIINIIDLANIDSCCFIATEDLGILYEDGSFTIQGRLDHSDIRGCNLMIN